jgi:hypothetical protein
VQKIIKFPVAGVKNKYPDEKTNLNICKKLKFFIKKPSPSVAQVQISDINHHPICVFCIL